MTYSADWRMLPEDLFTHLNDWRLACERMLSNAPPPSHDQDDAGYWQRQLDTLNACEDAVRAHDAIAKQRKWDDAWDAANRSAGVDI